MFKEKILKGLCKIFYILSILGFIIYGLTSNFIKDKNVLIKMFNLNFLFLILLLLSMILTIIYIILSENFIKKEKLIFIILVIFFNYIILPYVIFIKYKEKVFIKILDFISSVTLSVFIIILLYNFLVDLSIINKIVILIIIYCFLNSIFIIYNIINILKNKNYTVIKRVFVLLSFIFFPCFMPYFYYEFMKKYKDNHFSDSGRE